MEATKPGPEVVSMEKMCFNNKKLTGSPVCGNKVLNMDYAYYNCDSLTGIFTIGRKVKSMNDTFYNCNNLSGIDLRRKLIRLPRISIDTFPKGIKVYMTQKQYDKMTKAWKQVITASSIEVIVKELSEEI